MIRLRFIVGGAALALILLVQPGLAQELACDGTLYLITNQESGSKLERILQSGDGQVGAIEEIPLSDPQIRLTCLGLSVRDLHFYALDAETKELLRIESSGRISRLGVPQNLNTDLEYYAGSVTPTGRSLKVVGHDPEKGADVIIYDINLSDPEHYAGPTAALSERNIRMTDLAFDPLQGVTYGFDELGRQLVTLGAGSISTYAHTSIPESISALFFDANGQLFGYGNTAGGNSQNTLFRIDKFSGEAEVVATGSPGSSSDGCSCPYSVTFNRKVAPERVPPCGMVTIDYQIINRAGTSYLSIQLEDLLPPEFIITDILTNSSSLSTVESGVGGNELRVSQFDIRLGNRNRFRLRARVETSEARSFETQATMAGLPMGVGSNLPSNNPATAPPADANRTSIRTPSTESGEGINALYTCSGDSATLNLSFAAENYQWSTGATDSVIAVAAGQTYSVAAGNACFTFRDTISVNNPPPQPMVELGPDREVNLGAEVGLSVVSASADLQTLRWRTTGPDALSCSECPRPRLTATRDAQITLAAEDARGCLALDTLQLRVRDTRQIFVPDAFSPNGDGDNDLFLPMGLASTVIASFRVFDRWGNLLFERTEHALNDPDAGWDGRYRGRDLPTGIYVYQLEVRFADGRTQRFGGDVMLIR